MSNVYFIGDLHFGHKNICRIRPDFKTVDEHDEALCAIWNSKVKKDNDIVFVCGDAAFTAEGVERYGSLRGRKFLVHGNHDVFSTNRYLVHFEQVVGITKYKSNGKKFWVTHAPIHPDELRGRPNIHGHVHFNTIRTKDGEIDARYYNVSAENIGYEPRTIEELARLPRKSET